jgi:hypothetical protein
MFIPRITTRALSKGRWRLRKASTHFKEILNYFLEKKNPFYFKRLKIEVEVSVVQSKHCSEQIGKYQPTQPDL